MGHRALKTVAAAIISLVGTTTSLSGTELRVALTPANSPQHRQRDVDEMFAQGKQAGDAAVFIYQWGQPDFKDVAAKVTQATRQASLKTVLSISPTKLSGAQGEMGLPAAVQKKAGRNPLFGDKNVALPYIADVLDLGRPAAISADYYRHISARTSPNDKSVLSEPSWPSQGKGSDSAQEEFNRRLPDLLSKLKPAVVAWSLLHDVQTPQMDANLATTGLLTREGSAEPAEMASRAAMGRSKIQ